VVGWNDVRAGLDAVGFAQRRLGFEPDPLQAQILESRSKGLLLNCSRQWGKSTVSAIAALYRAWFRPGSLVVVTGPSERQAGEFVDKVREFASRLDIKPRGDGRNKSLVLPNGSRVVGVPSKQTTVRGFSGASMLVFDEAAHCPEELYLAMRPVLAASGETCGV
jgi:tRNA(Met) C34 N-acetyltransferase TmcA